MNSERKMDVEELHKLADSIRVIKDFSENHGFESDLFNVNFPPKKSTDSTKNTIKGGKDWSVVIFIICVILSLVCIGVNVYLAVTPKETLLLMLGSIIFTGFSIMAAHLRWKNITATTIAAGVLLAVVAIGYGVFTPKEVAEKAEKLIQGT